MWRIGVVYVAATITISSALVFNSGTSCPDGWIAFSGSCYLFGPHALDFSDAQFYCKDHGGSKLLRIDSDMENSFITDRLRNLKDRDWWLGIQYELGAFIWVYDRPGYNNTVPRTHWRYPLPKFSNYHCGFFNFTRSYTWDNGDCITKRTPICQLIIGDI